MQLLLLTIQYADRGLSEALGGVEWCDDRNSCYIARNPMARKAERSKDVILLVSR